MKGGSPFCSYITHIHHSLSIVCINMKDGSIDHFGHIRGIRRGARHPRVSSEANLKRGEQKYLNKCKYLPQKSQTYMAVLTILINSWTILTTYFHFKSQETLTIFSGQVIMELCVCYSKTSTYLIHLYKIINYTVLLLFLRNQCFYLAKMHWIEQTLIIRRNVPLPWTANQHIRIISKGSCDWHHRNKLHFNTW